MTYELHPLCTYFPRLSGAEFTTLCDDIKANGLRDPIVLHNKMILDGGNRYRACIEVGVKPRFRDFDGTNIVSFVLSANLHRRHLTPGQQAAIVASTQDWAKAQTHGGTRRSGQVATLPLETVAERAAAAGASPRTQRMADKVAKADPALAVKVGHGEVSLPKALAAVTPKVAPKAPTAERAITNDAHGDFDPIAEMEKMQRELESAHALIKAAEANDLKAEAMKWRRAYEAAQRTASEKMENAARLQSELQKSADRLTRIGKLFGERDPSKIAARVEAFFREHTSQAAA